MRNWTRRVLKRLELAEAHELNPHLQCDIRIAWITVLHAARGYSRPHVSASYTVLGLSPDKVWPAIVAKRKARLGIHYEQFFGGWKGESSAALPPKKPAQSVRILPLKKAA
jgi:hypothetical protein